MTPTLIILSWITVIEGKAVLNWHRIEQENKPIKHGLELVIVAIVALVHQALSGVNKIEEWELAGWILLFQVSSFALLFDLSLNLMRGKEPLYYGKTSVIDRLFHKLGNGAYLMYKVFALVIMVTSIIQIYKY